MATPSPDIAAALGASADYAYDYEFASSDEEDAYGLGADVDDINEPISGACPACGRHANRPCRGCLKRFYCNDKCARADWERHYDECTGAAAALGEPAPLSGGRSVRATPTPAGGRSARATPSPARQSVAPPSARPSVRPGPAPASPPSPRFRPLPPAPASPTSPRFRPLPPAPASPTSPRFRPLGPTAPARPMAPPLRPVPKTVRPAGRLPSSLVGRRPVVPGGAAPLAPRVYRRRVNPWRLARPRFWGGWTPKYYGTGSPYYGYYNQGWGLFGSNPRRWFRPWLNLGTAFLRYGNPFGFYLQNGFYFSPKFPGVYLEPWRLQYAMASLSALAAQYGAWIYSDRGAVEAAIVAASMADPAVYQQQYNTWFPGASAGLSIGVPGFNVGFGVGAGGGGAGFGVSAGVGAGGGVYV